MKKIAPRPDFTCYTFPHARSFLSINLNQVMIRLVNREQLANRASFLCKGFSPPYRTFNPLPQRRAKAINILDVNLTVSEIAKNLPNMRADNLLHKPIFNNLTIIHAVLVEEFQNRIKVLVITISAKAYFAIISWLLSPSGNLLIQLFTSAFVPFTDGESSEQPCFAL